MSDQLTIKDLQQALPATLKTAATQELADLVNNCAADPEFAAEVRNNFVNYAGILKEGKWKTTDYLNAVMYVSYKLMGYTNEEAYAKTFPKRYMALSAKTAKEKSAYISGYHRGKLVNLIMEQSLVPSWVLNQDHYQKAINVQADLMVNAQSEKVRQEAANSLMTHLGKPKEGGFQLKLDIAEASGMNELRELLTNMAKQQQDLIGQGVGIKDIAGQRIFPSETSQ